MKRHLAVLAAVACHHADLPADWEKAERVDDFTQSDCNGSPYDSDVPEVALTATPGDGTVDVAAEPVQFRCAQDLEAWWKEDAGKASMLVQPVDMDPTDVAKCDCLYRVDGVLPTTTATSVEVWRRWDNLNDPNPAISLGRVAVTR